MKVLKNILTPLALWLISVPVALAQDFGKENVTKVAQQAKLSTATSLPLLVGTIVKMLLGFLGLIFLVITVYAGFLWMTARGDEKKVTQAIGMLKTGIIGLIILFLSYTIALFVTNLVIGITAGKQP